MPSIWDEPNLERQIQITWMGCICFSIVLLANSPLLRSGNDDLAGLQHFTFVVCAVAVPLNAVKLFILKRYGDAGLRCFWARDFLGRPLHLWWGPFISLIFAALYARFVHDFLTWPIVPLFLLLAAFGAWRLVRAPASGV
jgi:hypothetical protein